MMYKNVNTITPCPLQTVKTIVPFVFLWEIKRIMFLMFLAIIEIIRTVNTLKVFRNKSKCYGPGRSSYPFGSVHTCQGQMIQ